MISRNIFGFTLIELMVTVVILSILAAISIPSYQNYVKKATVKAAETDLISLGLVFENYYQRNLSYPQQDYGSTPTLEQAFSQWSVSKKDVFDFSSESLNNGQGYRLTATANSSSNLSGCTLKLDNTNKKLITGCDIESW